MPDKSLSPTFCVVPWTHLATNSMGAYRVCCNATSSLNLVRDESGNPLYANKVAAKKAWNSPTYKTIRQQMLNGERPEMCARCFREEDSGVASARQNWNKQPWPEEPKVEAGFGIKFVDLRLGNLCNLKCRMCNPYSSSKWVDDWNQVVDTAMLEPKTPLSEKETQRIREVSWPQDPETWKNLEPVLENVEEIYLTGGEPFLSLEQSRLLQKIVDNGKASEVVIRYNTNLTTLPEKITNLWPHFKLIRINISFDAFGELNDYIRYPSQWSALEANMKKLIELRNTGWKLELSLHTTVQMYNVTRLMNIYTYFKNEFDIEPFGNILNHPHCLNIRTLPEPLKEKVIRNLENHPSQILGETGRYLKGESWYTSQWDHFVNYTRKLDSMRGQRLVDVLPEFGEFFHGK